MRTRRLFGATLLGGLLVFFGLVLWSQYLVPAPLDLNVSGLRGMVRVPGGVFRTAQDRRFRVEAFWIGRFEITEAEWVAYARESGAAMPPYRPDEPRGPDYPIRYVSHGDATAYAVWHLMRLPSNQEWERASQGEGGRAFPWGDGYLPAANTYETWDRRGFRGRGVTRVGTFELGCSAIGAYDMIGNVWEWTSSTYRDALRTTMGEDERSAHQFDLTTGEPEFIIRGGSFAQRIWGQVELERLLDADAKRWDVGFRCAIAQADLERQQQIIPWVRELALRDPINYLTRVRPARARLEELGAEALPYLRLAARRDARVWLRERLLDVVRRIEEAP